jgi:bacterioferritin-associated ferredoxin
VKGNTHIEQTPRVVLTLVQLGGLAIAVNLPAPAVGSLASLQEALKCGTHCGSCRPELKRRVRSARSAGAADETAQPRTVIPIKQLA